MPYPYGTQNAPVVGNGLGGLPRRGTITATANKKYPLKLQAVGSPITKSATGFNSFYGVTVPAGKNLCIHQSQGGSPSYLPFTFGMSYDANVGMIGFASNSSTVSAPATFMMPQGFSNGIIYNTGTTGQIYIGRTNGTTTTASQLVAIPSSGTFDDGSSYSSLGELYALPNQGYYMPVCFDSTGNLVLLYKTTVSSVTYISAFIINTSGTIVYKRKLFAVDGANDFSSSDTGYMVVKSGSGLIVAGSRATYNNCRFGIWNVSNDLATVTAYYSAKYNYLPDSSMPSNTTLNIGPQAAIFAASSSTYTAFWAGTIDSNGQVSTTNNVAPQYATIGSTPYLKNVSYFDANNYLYVVPSQKIQVGSYDAAYYSSTSIYAVGSSTSDGSIAIGGVNLVASASTPLSMYGIGNGPTLGYVGDGLWVSVNTDNNNVLYAQLYKEV